MGAAALELVAAQLQEGRPPGRDLDGSHRQALAEVLDGLAFGGAAHAAQRYQERAAQRHA